MALGTAARVFPGKEKHALSVASWAGLQDVKKKKRMKGRNHLVQGCSLSAFLLAWLRSFSVTNPSVITLLLTAVPEAQSQLALGWNPPSKVRLSSQDTVSIRYLLAMKKIINIVCLLLCIFVIFIIMFLVFSPYYHRKSLS